MRKGTLIDDLAHLSPYFQNGQFIYCRDPLGYSVSRKHRMWSSVAGIGPRWRWLTMRDAGTTFNWLM